MRKEEPFIQEICEFHKSQNLNGILSLIKSAHESQDQNALDILRLLTWPSPQKTDLVQLGNFINSNRVSHLFSIGCGTGLLEWLVQCWLQECGSDLGVTGIEVDFGWWSSSYSPPMFLPLEFVDRGFSSSDPFGDNQDMILFCYFNNLKVFLEYLQRFRGRYLAILGPISDKQFCEPAPLELQENPEMPGDQWRLVVFKPFGLGNVDHLAIYQKC